MGAGGTGWRRTVGFRDRHDAGRRLGEELAAAGLDDPLVVGLPRGGVVVAEEVAAALHAPLDVVLVRKLGTPGQTELAMGALGEDGTVLLNEDVVRSLGIREEEVERVAERERAEIERRRALLRGHRSPHPVQGREVVVVDAGLATGATARAAIRVLRHQGAGRVMLAVPVGAPATVAALRGEADDVICLETPPHLWAIGQWYDDFAQVTDHEVVEILDRAGRGEAAAEGPAPGDATDADPPLEAARRDVSVPAGRLSLPGDLNVPAPCRGVVVFAHGSGSSRHSPRNTAVAGYLNSRGLATLLFDLLTPDEAAERVNVFDVPLLAGRLRAAVHWVRTDPGLADLPVGLFGASTGAAAALCAAAGAPHDVAAVVSRGGRPDLARDDLAAVKAPTLLVVGGHDEVVLDLNRAAQRLLRCENRLRIVPGATHLFEEPGTLAVVAEMAGDWFLEHIRDTIGDR